MTSKIYQAELNRFGYTLTAVGRSKIEVAKAVMDAYVTAAESERGRGAASEPWGNGNKTLYELAIKDLKIREFEEGNVEFL